MTRRTPLVRKLQSLDNAITHMADHQVEGWSRYKGVAAEAIAEIGTLLKERDAFGGYLARAIAELDARAAVKVIDALNLAATRLEAAMIEMPKTGNRSASNYQQWAIEARTVARAARLGLFTRATERAKATLKPGDRLLIEYGCARKLVTVTMKGWEGAWICSARYTDIAATWIRKVNGVPTNFLDPEPGGYPAS